MCCKNLNFILWPAKIAIKIGLEQEFGEQKFGTHLCCHKLLDQSYFNVIS